MLVEGRSERVCFLIKNQTRSDFFIMMVNVVSCSCFQLLIGGRGEDSCGESGTDAIPQEHKRQEGSSTARGKRSLARESTAVSQAVQPIYPSCSYLE